MEKLVIDRRKWLRGEGTTGKSKLLRTTDSKMCCVGIYLESVCKVPRKRLRNLSSAQDVTAAYSERAKAPVPEWLVDEDGEHNRIAMQLYDKNDVEGTPDRTREKAIKRLFAQHKVAVTFIN